MIILSWFSHEQLIMGICCKAFKKIWFNGAKAQGRNGITAQRRNGVKA
jgi:hypothetical protein